MKPNFALKLSFEGVDLLHRVPTGWHLVGSVRFDDDDLTGALDDLREAAFRLEPDGLTSKLVLPDEQVKYLDIPTGGAGPNSYETMANRAMEGASPYGLSELAIDWVEKDGRLQVAAVARETLAEAEAFAHEHQFNPVSFVAQPAEGTFDGEPFFGGTHAATELFGGPVTPDREPITIIGNARPSEPEAAPEPTGAEQPETATSPAPEPETPEQAPLIEEIGVPSFDIISGPERAPDATPEPAADAPSEPEDYEEAARLAEQELGPDRPLTPDEEEMLKAFEADAAETAGAETPAAMKPAPDAEKPDSSSTPPLSFSTVRAKRNEAPDSAPPLSGAQRGLADAKASDIQRPDVSTPIPVAETQADDPSAAMLDMAASLRPTEPQEPATGGRKSFFNRGKRGNATSDRDNKTATRKEPLPDSLPATPPISVPEPETEEERLTVFGAREGDAVGGKPRFLGLVLTALLLVFLVVMAAWASFSTDGLASLFRRDTGDSVAALSPDMATEEELAEAGTPATATTDPPLDEAIALPAPELEPEPDLHDALQDTPDPAALPTLQNTEERYATTGIWQAAPDQPEVPGTSALEDLYVASIDHPVLAFDAVALPDPQRMNGDAAPAQPADPLAAGTRFDFDQRGLVKASPEGSLSPEGIVIYSGKPPVTPPKWPERQEGRSEVNELENTRLAALRPRIRPEDLIEQTERNNLGGRTRVELAALRPRLRPESAQELAAGNDKPTANAVVASLLPKNRPTNFADIVAQAEEQPETQLATGSIFKPQSVQPTLPTKASVARQATVKNQINLRKINLIGVYGQPSNRRALVRLSSGRYKKVKVGDRINGGKVAAIGESELRYVKSGRSITLKMPKG